MSSEIFVVSPSGQGHLSPCMELCKLLATRNYKTTLVIPSNASSSVPASFLHHHPLLAVAQIAAAPPNPMMAGSDPHIRQKMTHDIESHISDNPTRILCAIIDFQVGWAKEVFFKFSIPVIGFFTFGACAAAMEHASWKAQVGDLKPDETRELPGLPEEMSLSYSDLKRRPGGGPPGGGPKPSGGPGGPGGPGGGGPKLGNTPVWLRQIEGSIALMFNTCFDLERPFIEYLVNELGCPVWGVGPLLPEQYWASAHSLISDSKIRSSKRESNYTEHEVIQWLDSKPRGSVLYVSFGSVVGPTDEEYPELSAALEESSSPFIWVIQSRSEGSYFPHDLSNRIGDKGLVIHGWAPQLLILSHPSTGGFLSHCGWNSTAEAIGRGVPFLAWPLRGDQFLNAKLVVNHWKVGYMAYGGDASQMVKKEDLVNGIQKLMGNEEIKSRAEVFSSKFHNGFPKSAEEAFDEFGDFITQNPR